MPTPRVPPSAKPSAPQTPPTVVQPPVPPSTAPVTDPVLPVTALPTEFHVPTRGRRDIAGNTTENTGQNRAPNSSNISARDIVVGALTVAGTVALVVAVAKKVLEWGRKREEPASALEDSRAAAVRDQQLNIV